jgi:hypothetical protein
MWVMNDWSSDSLSCLRLPSGLVDVAGGLCPPSSAGRTEGEPSEEVREGGKLGETKAKGVV